MQRLLQIAFGMLIVYVLVLDRRVWRFVLSRGSQAALWGSIGGGVGAIVGSWADADALSSTLVGGALGLSACAPMLYSGLKLWAEEACAKVWTEEAYANVWAKQAEAGSLHFTAAEEPSKAVGAAPAGLETTDPPQSTQRPGRAPGIDPRLLRKLSRPRWYLSLGAFLLDCSTIAFAIWLCERISIWLYPVAFVLTGSRRHAFAALAHDGAHRTLSSRRWFNEALGELCAWLQPTTMIGYRRLRHLPHHRDLGTLDDPHVSQTYARNPKAWAFPMRRGDLARQVLRAAVFGLLSAPFSCLIPQVPVWSLSKPRCIAAGAFWLVVWAAVGMATVTLGWIALGKFWMYWLAPGAWSSAITGYFRLASEHFGMPSTTSGGTTRSMRASYLTEAILWPHNLNYHLEHHWYPSVPWFNLPDLHRHLVGRREIRARMHVTYGARALLGELTVSE